MRKKKSNSRAAGCVRRHREPALQRQGAGLSKPQSSPPAAHPSHLDPPLLPPQSSPWWPPSAPWQHPWPGPRSAGKRMPPSRRPCAAASAGVGGTSREVAGRGNWLCPIGPARQDTLHHGGCPPETMPQHVFVQYAMQETEAETGAETRGVWVLNRATGLRASLPGMPRCWQTTGSPR